MRRPAVVPCALGLLPLAACGAATPQPAATPPVTVTVLAAASLRGVLDEVAAGYERTHPGTTVRISYGGSAALAQQVVQGAPADLLATASVATMDTARASGRLEQPAVIATNTMAVAVPPANPGHVTGLADLARPGVTVALCQAAVPCGAAATTVLGRAHVAVKPVTLEGDVTAVLTKVSLGEVDAGIVYATDIRAAAGRVTGITIPAGVNTTTRYPVAVVTDGPQAAAARDLRAYATSAEAAAVLARHGFGRP